MNKIKSTTLHRINAPNYEISGKLPYHFLLKDYVKVETLIFWISAFKVNDILPEDLLENDLQVLSPIDQHKYDGDVVL